MLIKFTKNGFISIGTLLIIMLASPFISSMFINVQTTEQIYEKSDEIPQKELGLVLGAAVYGNKLSDILRDRVDTSIELYKKKKISLIIMSGSSHEAKTMKQYAIKNNIPEESILLDEEGFNTLASIENINPLNRSVSIISQKYHLPRALFIANAKGLDAVGMTADKHIYIKIIQFKTREIFANSKAILDILYKK